MSCRIIQAVQVELATCKKLLDTTTANLNTVHSAHALSKEAHDATIHQLLEKTQHLIDANAAANELRREGTHARELVARKISEHMQLSADMHAKVQAQQDATLEITQKLDARNHLLAAANVQVDQLMEALENDGRARADVERLANKLNDTDALLHSSRQAEKQTQSARAELVKEMASFKSQCDRDKQNMAAVQQDKELLQQELYDTRIVMARDAAELLRCNLQLGSNSKELVHTRSRMQEHEDSLIAAKAAVVVAQAAQSQTQIELNKESTKAQDLTSLLTASTASIENLHKKVETLTSSHALTRSQAVLSERNLADVQKENMVITKKLDDMDVNLNGQLAESNGALLSLNTTYDALQKERDSIFEEMCTAQQKISFLHLDMQNKQLLLQGALDERDELADAHNLCRPTPICGVGVQMWDSNGDGAFQVREVTLGSSCWFEQLACPGKVLPQVGDHVRMINSRLITSQAMVAELCRGLEGTQVNLEILEHKKDILICCVCVCASVCMHVYIYKSI